MAFGDIVSREKTSGFGSVTGRRRTSISGFGKKKIDLTTPEGLIEKAFQEDNELAKKVQKIASKPKEDPDVIFSGGLISDIFDGLNALQYGIVGLTKGKTFGEGVKTRESYSKKDALGQYGIPGLIGGIALDIALDPLTYVGGFGIGKRIFAGLAKVAPVAVKAMRAVPLGDKAVDFLGSKFIYRFGQDPVYADLAERMIKNIAIGQENLLDLARPLTKLDPEIQKIIATARKAGKLEELPPRLLKIAKPAFDELDRLGKEAVEVGLLDAATYEKNVGRYIARLYKTKEAPEQARKLFAGRKPLRIDLSRFKKRQDIPEEIRNAMGEMLEAGYPTAKSLVQLKDAVEKTKFFNEVARRWGKETLEEGIEKGWTKLPEARGLFTTATGEKIKKLSELKTSIPFRNKLEKLFRQDVKAFRGIEGEINKLNIEGLYKSLGKELDLAKAKVVTVKTGALFKTGRPAYAKYVKYPSVKRLVEDLVNLPTADIRRIKAKIATRENRLFPVFDDLINLSKQHEEIVGKIGGLREGIKTDMLGELAGKFVPTPIADDLNFMIEGAKKAGIGRQLVAGFKYGKVILNPATHGRNILSNFILNSFEGLSPLRLDIYGEAAKELATKGKWYQEAKSVGLGMNTWAANELKAILTGIEGKGLSAGLKRAGKKIAGIYQGEEEFAKLAQYIFQRKSGLGIDEAWKIAERATFNYTQVTPFIRRLRESVFGMPFITFTYKATPQVLKTAIKYPTRISNIGKIKSAIENLSERKILKAERAAEPDYIRDGFFMRLPKKDKYGRSSYFDLSYIIPFGEILSGQLYQPGVGETAPQTILGKFPALNVIMELGKNKDFFGNKIVKDSSTEPSEQGKDIFQYLLKFYSPQLLEGGIETLFNADAREEVGLKGLLPGRLGRSIKMEEEGATEIINQMKTTRTATQELLRAFLGLKVTPFNVDKEISRRDNELRKKLQQILIDEGLIKEFTIPFVPK